MASNHPVSGWSILDSIFWIMAGPAILIVSACMSYTSGNCWLAPASIIFLVVLAGVVVARCLDSHTADGEPSTTTRGGSRRVGSG